jgi:putative endonuclease
MNAKQFQLPPTSAAERRYQLAKTGERFASEHLNSLGYSIVGQNVRVGAWEIDLICRFNNEIIFVEVKTTGSNYRPEDRVSNSQQKRLFQAAERWLLKSRLENHPARFDLIIVEFNTQTGDCRIDHHIDALRRDNTRSTHR